MEKEKFSKDLVLYVANLAKLEVSEKEIELYQYQLKNILNEIDKISKVNIEVDEILIAPTNNINVYREDKVGDMLNVSDVLKNANNTNDDYIEVVGVINE